MIIVACTKCKNKFFTCDYRGWQELKDDDMGYCDECGGKNKIIRPKDITNPKDLMALLDNDEDISGGSAKPGELYKRILPLVGKSKALKLARAIYFVYGEVV